MCIDCVDPNRAIKVLERCKQLCDFGEVKLLTDDPTSYEHRVKIMPLNSLVAYSIFMLTKVHEYIETPNVLIVQRDGWILNPESWDKNWLFFDYIGPLFVQYDKVGSGGFSLRSKKIMKAISNEMPEWDGSESIANEIQKTLGYYEDGVICLSDFHKSYQIARPVHAAHFSQGGNRNPKYFDPYPFGFHRTWQEIDFKTGLVDSSDTSKSLHESYDHVPL